MMNCVVQKYNCDKIKCIIKMEDCHFTIVILLQGENVFALLWFLKSVNN